IVPTLIEGIKIGLGSLVSVSVITVLATYLAYRQADMYGLILAVVGMFSIVVITIASETAGHIADNAGGIIGLAGLSQEAHEIVASLDAMGNTRAAISKGLLSVSSLIISFVLLVYLAGSMSLDFFSMKGIIGLLAGVILPLMASAWLLRKVTASALKVSDEVKSQLDGNRTDYDSVTRLVSKAGIMSMVLIGILSLAGPIVLGKLFGLEFLSSLLLGSLIMSFLISVFCAVSGGVWDNAKKIVEKNGGASLQTAVVGDTFGDPLKDLVGPAMSILVKVMILASLVFLPFIS
ncbi:MAG: sodium/proton-translocating pyrophosphatase, partial [Patescibacteria group bacterium]